MTFNYENTDTPDDVVRSVAAEMSGGGLKPLSEDERLQREQWRQEQYQREQERKADQEYRQLMAEEAARQEAAEALAQANREARIQLRER
jgi:iron only hydrogenase large subunit-like protein